MNEPLEEELHTSFTLNTDNLVDLSLATAVCPDNATMIEVRGDSEYITISMQSMDAERKITIRNKWNATDFCYWHPAEALQASENEKLYFELVTGQIVGIRKPMHQNGFSVASYA